MKKFLTVTVLLAMSACAAGVENDPSETLSPRESAFAFIGQETDQELECTRLHPGDASRDEWHCFGQELSFTVGFFGHDVQWYRFGTDAQGALEALGGGTFDIDTHEQAKAADQL